MKLLQRILALLGAVALLGLSVLTFYCAITGSPYFMASLFCMIAIPIFIYGYLIVFRAFSAKNKEKMYDAMEEEKQSPTQKGEKKDL